MNAAVTLVVLYNNMSAGKCLSARKFAGKVLTILHETIFVSDGFHA